MPTQDQPQNPISQTSPTSVSQNSAKTAQAPNAGMQSKSVLRPLQTQPVRANSITTKGNAMKKPQIMIMGILVVILGIVSGYGLAVMRNEGSGTGGLINEPGLKREISAGEITKGTKVGVSDEKTFKDSAEGQLEKGGIEGEGSHHLIRPGGESQTVYITSSIIDLDQFIGRKVKIWGETMAADKAGWFMDVGKLEVLE